MSWRSVASQDGTSRFLADGRAPPCRRPILSITAPPRIFFETYASTCFKKTEKSPHKRGFLLV